MIVVGVRRAVFTHSSLDEFRPIFWVLHCRMKSVSCERENHCKGNQLCTRKVESVNERAMPIAVRKQEMKEMKRLCLMSTRVRWADKLNRRATRNKQASERASERALITESAGGPK